jgi:medium-chain acyl-[acyl-carrier-protein] hydrolase
MKIDLLCLPFAGGSSYSYTKIRKFASSSVNFVLIDLPGRGDRFGEPLLTDMNAMAEDVFLKIRVSLHKPYAIYGHSMGGMLGYLLCRKITRRGLPLPLHLIVSGAESPTAPNKAKNIHLLPDAAFRKKLIEFGGLPDEIFQEQDLLDLFMPVIRADFEAAEKAREKISGSTIDIPITVMTGLEDSEVSCEEAGKWQEVTTKKFTIHHFPGGHFFIFDHAPEIGELISRIVMQC